MEQDVAQQFRAQAQIGPGHVEGNAEAVIAGVAPEVAADRFDHVRDLLGRARCRALDDHLRHQAGDSIRRARLRQQAAAKRRHH